MAKELVRVWKRDGFMLKVSASVDEEGRLFCEGDLFDGELRVEGLLYYPLESNSLHDIGLDSDTAKTLEIITEYPRHEHSANCQIEIDEPPDADFTPEQLAWRKGPRRKELYDLTMAWLATIDCKDA